MLMGTGCDISEHSYAVACLKVARVAGRRIAYGLITV